MSDYFIHMIALDIRRKVDLPQEQTNEEDEIRIVFKDVPRVVHPRIIPILEQHGLKFTSRSPVKGAYLYHYSRNKFAVDIFHYPDHTEVFVTNENNKPRDKEIPHSAVHKV